MSEVKRRPKRRRGALVRSDRECGGRLQVRGTLSISLSLDRRDMGKRRLAVEMGSTGAGDRLGSSFDRVGSANEEEAESGEVGRAGEELVEFGWLWSSAEGGVERGEVGESEWKKCV
ncbi:hypothetical protein KFK09_014232 [Dendrobium nobile]|uniref:Uncharacterized protein n=1 Tax=Dendrobium nobile TaxID=94219 RepID=A0A8T3BBB0_DENNO|nr:hypothetical protein KFK09_014232 [Dendrobium nobile]